MYRIMLCEGKMGNDSSSLHRRQDRRAACVRSLPKDENLCESECPILYATENIGQKWKLPILWYIADADNQTLRCREPERKAAGITAAMLTKCLRELEADRLISRTQYSTILPAVEYALTERGKTLVPALESVCGRADRQMKTKENDKTKTPAIRLRTGLRALCMLLRQNWIEG